MSKKKLLIISYYWPPSGGSGVQRWVYFAKYLKRLGFEPIVLTVDPEKASYPSLDETLLKEVADITVHRTTSFEPLQWYSRFVTGKKNVGIPFGEVNTKKQGLFKKTAAFVRGNFILPDARKYWKKYALPKAKELIQQENIELIITTGPPHSTHLIGLALKSATQLPWIADFRDPWTEIFYNKDLFRTKYAERKDLMWETKVLNAADKVLAISPGTAELLAAKMTQPSNIHCLLNGFDHEQFDPILSKTNERFTISYVGYLGKHHRTQTFNRLLAQLDFPVTLHLAGNMDEEILAYWKGLSHVNVLAEGQVDHDRALAIIQQADLLYISIPFSTYSKGNIPGKLLEYLATKRPILLEGETDSDAAQLLSKFPHALTIEDDTTLDTFQKFVVNVKEKSFPPIEDEKIQQYSRAELTHQLTEIIMELL